MFENKWQNLFHNKDDSGPSKVRELEDKCLSLQNQVYDMEVCFHSEALLSNFLDTMNNYNNSKNNKNNCKNINMIVK